MNPLHRAEQQWLADRRAVVADVRTHLDVEAGLREVLIASQHASVRETVAAELDVEAGLAAILLDGSATPLAANDFHLAGARAADSGPVLRLIDELGPVHRLALRTHPSGRSYGLAALRIECKELAAHLGNLAIVGLTDELERTLRRSQHRVHHHDFNRAADFAHALDVAHALVAALGTSLDRIRALATRLHGDMREVARDLAGTLDRAIGKALMVTRDLATGREHLNANRHDGLDRTLGALLHQLEGLHLSHARALAHDLDVRLVRELELAVADDETDDSSDDGLWTQPARKLSVALRATPTSERAATLVWLRDILDDAIGADLRDADLTSVPLAGIRWSETTQWPARWQQHVREHSTPVDGQPGVYIIQEEPPR